jgi:hypothetical protein
MDYLSLAKDSQWLGEVLLAKDLTIPGKDQDNNLMRDSCKLQMRKGN